MADVTLTRSALRDLDGIWDHIAERDAERASRFVRRLRDTMDLLADQPLMGRQRDDLAERLRSFVIEEYVAFYYPTENGVVVSRILHSRRDIRPDLFD